MMPWIRSTPVAFAGLVRPAACALPGEPLLAETPPRAAQAQALAHAAARRRRAASDLIDGEYWRALVPQALACAQSLRADLPRFP